MPDHPPQSIPRAFISYSTRNKAFVDEIVPYLSGHGIDVWYDRTGLDGGDDLPTTIKDQINTSEFFILVMSEESIASTWVHKEVQWALDHSQIQIIPVRIDSCNKTRFPACIVGKHIIDFAPNPRGARSKLVRRLLHKTARFQTLMRQGRFCCSRSEFSDAVRHFSAALKMRPSSHAPLKYRAYCYRKLGSLKNALRDIGRVIRQRPGDLQAFVFRSELFLDNKDYELALRDCNTALLIDSNSSRALATRGRANFMRGDYNSAIGDFKAAIALEPGIYNVLKHLGMALNDAGRIDEAAAVFADAVREAPEDAVSRFLLGYAYHQLGRHQDAVHHYEKAVELEPKYFRVWYCMGYALYEHGQFSRAREAFCNVIQSFPGNGNHSPVVSALIGRGRAALALRDLKAAMDDADRAIELDGRDKRAWLLRAHVLFEMGLLRDAFLSCRSVFKYGECAETYEVAAKIADQSGQHEECARYQRKAAELRPALRRGGFLGIRGRVQPTHSSKELKPAQFIRPDRVQICRLKGFKCRGASCW